MAIQTVSGSIRKVERYNPDQIELIKQSLQQLKDAGKPRFYEIKVDGLQMVGKTTDLSHFDCYEQNISEDTEEIKFMLYQGTSHKYDSFTHVFKEDIAPVPTLLPSLNDIPELLEDKVKQALRERDVVDYRKRIIEIEEELEENKDYVELLEKQIEGLQRQVEILTLAETSKNRNHDLILALLAKGGEFIKRNPQVLNNIPLLGETLAGDMQRQNKEEELRIQQEYILLKQQERQMQVEQPEPNATFSEKEL
ncbi:MAG: hypothetical protein IPI46_09890 [Bacteroidetes bacterium]|nr:hypothetical protein [Bacteroidota bacterium]